MILSCHLGDRRVRHWTRAKRYGAVVSTYPLASQTLGTLRARGRLTVPAVTYLTDPAAHRTWVHRCVDLHLTVTTATAEHGEAIYGFPMHAAGPLVPPRFAGESRPGAPRRGSASRARDPRDRPVALLVSGLARARGPRRPPASSSSRPASCRWCCAGATPPCAAGSPRCPASRLRLARRRPRAHARRRRPRPQRRRPQLHRGARGRPAGGELSLHRRPRPSQRRRARGRRGRPVGADRRGAHPRAERAGGPAATGAPHGDPADQVLTLLAATARAARPNVRPAA